MKKIYLMGLSAAFALTVNAQSIIKVKNPLKKRGVVTENATAKVSGPSQVAATIVCNTQYVAGSTMDLNFTYTASNSDLEFVDYLEIIFPAGITPNSSGNATFPTSNSAGGAEALNPIVGQTISWGVDNNDQYGGIITTASGVNFTVNVTVAGGTTGNQIATFNASGDGYGAAPGDLNGATFTIFPAGSAVVNMQTKLLGVITNTTTGDVAGANNCGLTTHLIVSQIHNLGNQTESNIPANYSVNGVASIATTYTGSIAPGDSAYVFFPMPYDFSANGTYTVKAWTSMAGDIGLGNDTAAVSITNSNPVALTSTTYTNGIQTAYDFASITQSWAGLGVGFSNQTTHAHSGGVALFWTINNTTMGAPNGTYETMNILPCMDVTSGDTYRISYWKKSATSGTLTVNGQSGIFSGLNNDIADMTDVLKAYSALTPTNAPGVSGWVKDSVDYVAASTETRYFAIGGKGVLSAPGQQINVRIDDIRIEKIITTGIKNNTLTTASLFPNPSTGLLNINNIEAVSTVEVYNVIGDKVYSNKLDKGNNAIDLSNLANGSYFVKINSNNGTTTKKVVISK